MFNIKTGNNINHIIGNIDSHGSRVKLAAAKALNKTALWLKAQAAKEISEEKKIKLTVMRRKLRIFKAKTSRLEVSIRANLYDMRASSIGIMRETRRGTKVGKHEFIGAFTATMPRGYKGAFKREGKTGLPIKEVKLPLEPEAPRIIKELAERKVEEVFEKYFYQQMGQ